MRIGTRLLAAVGAVLCTASAQAATTTFFSAPQGHTVTSGSLSDTLGSLGYEFTYTLDKQFMGAPGTVTGRPQQLVWPAGLHVQAVTAGAPGPAKLTIRRSDHQVFDLSSLSFKLLASTVITGAQLELTPILNGTEGPIVLLDATGISGKTFNVDLSAMALKGYDTYKLGLFTDFALTQLTVVDATVSTVPEPTAAQLSLAGLAMLAAAARRKAQVRPGA